jgi:hypothetical protein
MIKRLFILHLLMVYFINSGISQGARDFVSLKNFTPPSPESIAMQKYGDVPVDLSAGIVQVSVPIYEIKSRQLSLPISISYHASGIKVQDLATPVGLGWVLNAGGSISRNVVGKADERSNGIIGLGVGALRNRSTLESSQYNLNDNTDFAYLANLANGNSDSQSDIYHFNMPGINGKFVYDIALNIKHQPVDKQLQIIRTSNNMFKIVNDDGVIYEFNEIEKTDAYLSSDTTTWHLTRMISADKSDTITFEYISGAGYSDFEASQTFYIEINKAESQVSLCDIYAASPQFGHTEEIVNYYYQRKLLSKIKFAGGYVQFEYSNDRQDPVPERLNKIMVFNVENSLIGQYQFSHNYFISEDAPTNSSESKYFKRLKLDSLKFQDANAVTNNMYSFEYNQVGSFPGYRNSIGRKPVSIDFWGYYNQAAPGNMETLLPANFENAITEFITGLYGYPAYSSTIISSYQNKMINRYANPNIQFCMLKKVNYPTGGSTEFEYEGNRISNLGNNSDFVGGQRIKSVKSFDPLTQSTRIKAFEYSTGTPVTKILPYSFYHTKSNYVYKWGNIPPYFAWCHNQYFYITGNPASTINYYNGSPVIYQTVTEYDGNLLANKGKIVYTYDVEGDSIYSSPYLRKYMYFSTIKDWARGNLLQQKIYKRAGLNYELIKMTTNEYAKFGQVPVKVGQLCELTSSTSTPNLENYLAFLKTNSYAAILLNYFDYEDVVIPFGTKKLIKTTEVDYLNDTVVNKNEYFYESPNHLYVSKQKKYNSDESDVKVTELKYPQDKTTIIGLTSESTSALDGMIAANIKTPVIESKVSKNNVQFIRDLVEYRNWSLSGVNRFYPEYMTRQLKNEPPERRVQILSYDSRGNITSQKKMDDAVTTYIWGYEKLYPVATIIGKTYDEAVSQANLDLNIIHSPTSEALLRMELNKLRILPGTLVNTFTYKKLVGVNSQTDAKGLISFYEYDGMNRLSLIRDKDNNILKKICYNYAGQPDNCDGPATPLQYFNEVQSQAFTRNNCGSCAVGSQVTYTVPANTYSSTVSVAAANQLALNDIAANGQNYANTNGTCTANGVNITYSNLTSQSGYTATYTNMATSQVYTFTVPASGSGNLGCIPSGTYSLSITKSGVQIPSLFGTGCYTQSGTSASFWKVIVGPPSNCNVVSIEVDY